MIDRVAIKAQAREVLRTRRGDVIVATLLTGLSAYMPFVGMAASSTFGSWAARVYDGDTDCMVSDLLNGIGTNFLRKISGLLKVAIYTWLWSILLLIPGIIKSYSYSLTSYILHDNPLMTGGEAITESRRLMKGHKWQLFVLQLSFIGWILLGILTFGIVMVLHTIPYYELAMAGFYAEVKRENHN